MGYEKPLTGAQRVARRRSALRAQGLRPKTFWLPDVSSDAFKAQAALACAAIDKAWQEGEAQGWLDAMTDAALAEYPPPDGLV